MRNLKRALSLALAAIMLIGMMVVSASAAGFDDFSDKDEIVNKDAVSMLTILGVINGKEDGSFFDPAGNVTRAEMAKMIATVLNQGADVDGLYVGMNTGLTDVKGLRATSTTATAWASSPAAATASLTPPLPLPATRPPRCCWWPPATMRSSRA